MRISILFFKFAPVFENKMSNIINLKSMRKLFTLALMCMLTFAGFAQDPGTYDESFGVNGVANFAPSSSHDFIETVLTQEDGKIITVGRSRYDASNYDVYVSRQNTDGTLDANYGMNGIMHLQATPAIYINAGRDAVFGNDGLLYVCGYTYDYTDNQGFVYCLDENGFEYPYFGNNGVALSEYGGGIVYEAIDIDSYGRPIVTGYLNDTVFVRRFNLAGIPDPNFGENGTLKIDIPGSLFSFAYDIKVLPDNKILVSGFRLDLETSMQKAFLVRLTANGSLDSTFGNGGVLILNVGPFADYANAIDIAPDGNYIIAGHSELPSNDEVLPRYESFVTRVKTDGTIDSSFGTNGFTRFESFSGEGCINNSETVVVADDGQIFGTYYSYNYFTLASRAYVYNVDQNGQLKESFAGTGILPLSEDNIDIDGITEIRTYSAALRPDGKLVVGGYAYHNDGYASDIFVACINTDIEGDDPIDPEIYPADVELTTEAIDAHTIKANVIPNEYTVEYHIGYVSKTMFDQVGAEMLAQAIQADGNPQTDAKEFTYGDLEEQTEYVVIATAKNEADEWIVKTSNVTTPQGIGYEDIEATRFNIYPNPATSVVFIETNGNAQVSIIDITGRIVKEVETTENVTTISVNDINRGVYFIMVQDANNRIVEKLVVK